VFRNAQCPYCVELEQRVLPRVRERARPFEERFENAAKFEGVRVTPSILIRGPRGHRWIEGLPDPDRLLADLEAVR
jgi:protein-disulfide isomerase